MNEPYIKKLKRINIKRIIVVKLFLHTILELEKHKKEHPDVFEISRKSYTLPKFCEKHNINIKNYSFLAMDIQGAEFLVLKGMNEMLDDVKYIYMEVNTKEIYKDNVLLNDLTQFLKLKGCYLIDVKMTHHGWGDAFYSRENLHKL